MRLKRLVVYGKWGEFRLMVSLEPLEWKGASEKVCLCMPFAGSPALV